jgi:MoaA/NifB/PqqE/SkfB family radical SAM enzyme
MERESRNITSMRQNINTEFNPDTKINKAGRVKHKDLKFIELRFSNTCNLACLHCGPDYSSQWASIVKNNPLKDEDKKHNIRGWISDSKNTNWTTKQVKDFVTDINTNFPNIERFDIAGGEPLYQKQFWLFLDLIQHHPNIKNMSINITSNFNVDIDYKKLAKTLNMFKSAFVRISLDAGKNLYDYFRGGSWTEITKNINEFNKYRKNIILEVTNTIGVYQILDLEDVITSMLELPVDRLHHSIIQYPDYLSPHVFSPSDVYIQDKIKNFKVKLKNYSSDSKYTSAFRMVKAIEKEFDNSRYNPKLLDSFKYYTNKMDNIKNIDFESVYGYKVDEL